MPNRSVKVIGAMKTSEAIERMAAAGDPRARTARRLLRESGRDVVFSSFIWGTDNEPVYKEKEHQYGYFGVDANDPQDVLDIKDAGNIAPDESLKDQRIRLTLDRLRVYDYPGDGNHTVLVQFSASHQVSGTREELSFNQKYQASEGSGAGVRGYPIFVGLSVPAEGIQLRGLTVNVENDDDKQILRFLDSPVFKRGLELLNTVNPVMPIVTSFATGLTESFARRNENVAVQDFSLGLDFSGVPSRAYLREGSYVVVQANDEQWNWADWKFTRSTGKLSAKQGGKPIPYNYLVLGVSKM